LLRIHGRSVLLNLFQIALILCARRISTTTSFTQKFPRRLTPPGKSCWQVRCKGRHFLLPFDSLHLFADQNAVIRFGFLLSSGRCGRRLLRSCGSVQLSHYRVEVERCSLLSRRVIDEVLDLGRHDRL